MRKNFSFVLILVVLAVCLSSCTTVKGYKMNHVTSEDYVINTAFSKEDYIVVGTVSGESDFVYYDNSSREYIGDSHNYGFVNGRLNASIDKDFYIGTGRDNNSFNIPSNALETAKMNALYMLIEDARTLGAHFIFEPNYTIETQPDPHGKTLMYKVKVTAMAARLYNFF